jgi:hypothetical protein
MMSNFAWSVALGVAIVTRHDRRKLEGLEWRLVALRSHRRRSVTQQYNPVVSQSDHSSTADLFQNLSSIPLLLLSL